MTLESTFFLFLLFSHDKGGRKFFLGFRVDKETLEARKEQTLVEQVFTSHLMMLLTAEASLQVGVLYVGIENLSVLLSAGEEGVRSLVQASQSRRGELLNSSPVDNPSQPGVIIIAVRPAVKAPSLICRRKNSSGDECALQRLPWR